MYNTLLHYFFCAFAKIEAIHQSPSGDILAIIPPLSHNSPLLSGIFGRRPKKSVFCMYFLVFLQFFLVSWKGQNGGNLQRNRCFTLKSQFRVSKTVFFGPAARFTFRNHDLDAEGDRVQKEFRNSKLDSLWRIKKVGSLRFRSGVFFWEIVYRENNYQSFLH